MVERITIPYALLKERIYNMNDLLGLFLSHKFYEQNRHLIAIDFFEMKLKRYGVVSN